MNLNICGGAYSIEAPVAVQECINMYPEVQQQGSQEQIILRRFPGLKSFSSFTGNPIRGMKRMDGVLYVVAAAALYSVSAGGLSILLGNIAGDDLVSMATDGTNLVIVNGTDTGYVYNGTSLTEIADADFVASSKVLYLDTYFIHLRPDTNQFFISESGSATSYIATDRGTKEGAPGNIVSMITSNRDLHLLGEDTTENWRVTSNPDFPVGRLEGTFQERGALGLNTPAEMDNDIYYLGDDKSVYRLSGFTPVRISHHAIEKWISEQQQTDIDAAIGMTITHQGHYWYILSFAGGTWAYDSTTSAMLQRSEWFQLQSWQQDNWRVDVTETAYGKTLCGGADGVVYELDPDTFDENGTTQLKRRTSPYYHSERRPITPNRIKLGFKQGVGNSSVADPVVGMSISKDWGRTFSNDRQRSMGQQGQYRTNATWNRNGISRGAVLRWTVTDSVDVTFTGAYGEVAAGPG